MINYYDGPLALALALALALVIVIGYSTSLSVPYGLACKSIYGVATVVIQCNLKKMI